MSEAIDSLRAARELSLTKFVEACRAGAVDVGQAFGLSPAQADRLAKADPEVLMRIEELDLPPTTSIQLNTAPHGQARIAPGHLGSIDATPVVEQAVNFVRRNTTVRADLVDGARREEQWDYPEPAVREAVVNAVVHRDHLLSATDVELSLYSDRLEVISPGRLPNGITPERMLFGCRAARNQLLKDVMRDYGYLEHMGMGVPRKIVKTMRELNGTEPELIEDGERFIVPLWKKRL